jgi:protein phosphatase
MAPCDTSSEAGLLEHPAQAFAYFRHESVEKVICEEKHMGSRAVIIVCRDAAAARRRFGVAADEIGICYTRTGRRFFDDLELEHALLARIASAAESAALWDELETDWLCLDCELMPWSAKAQELIRSQYAAVGAASRVALAEVIRELERGASGLANVDQLLERERERLLLANKFTESYRRYCWPVRSIDDLRVAPFHLLASEGNLHTSKDHRWHMETTARLTRHAAPLMVSTNHLIVDLMDPKSEAEATAWWSKLTARGGEGMVVKPLDFIARGRRGLAQPAMKCRGPEYLRIIYGPEYTRPENLERLRSRGLSVKRSLALREFSLGVESLERFVRGEPLRRVHECVFGVLALESEPVDPRL